MVTKSIKSKIICFMDINGTIKRKNIYFGGYYEFISYIQKAVVI